MDWDFFQELLNFDSTSGKEWEVAEWLVRTLPDMFPPSHRPDVRADEVGDGTINLLFTWGEPKIVFCSHLDTVPPYIAPKITKNTRVYKGGSWRDRIYWLNPASRRYMEQDRSSSTIGFRCAMSTVGNQIDNGSNLK